jgi:hypothetical protein
MSLQVSQVMLYSMVRLTIQLLLPFAIKPKSLERHFQCLVAKRIPLQLLQTATCIPETLDRHGR